MDFEEQLETEHLLLVDRVCKQCGVRKSLLADYYKIRKNLSLKSSYSYECKTCTRDRIKEKNRKKYRLGKCEICKKTNTKLVTNICQDCNKFLNQYNYDVDTMKNFVLYLSK